MCCNAVTHIEENFGWKFAILLSTNIFINAFKINLYYTVEQGLSCRIKQNNAFMIVLCFLGNINAGHTIWFQGKRYYQAALVAKMNMYNIWGTLTSPHPPLSGQIL